MKIAIITPFKNFAGGVESVNKLLEGILTNNYNIVDFITIEDYKCTYLDKIMIKIIGTPWITSKRFKLVSETYDLVICNGEFGFGIDHPHAICVFHGCYFGYHKHMREYLSIKESLKLLILAKLQKYSARGKFVISVSTFVAKLLEQQGISVNKTLANCIDTEKFRPFNMVNNGSKLLFVGTYSYYGKGFDILEKLVDYGYKIDCVTNVYPGNKLGWIKNIPNDKMIEVYRKYKIVVFPSRFEGLQLVPLEAMACGLPVIISKVGLGEKLIDEIPEFVVSSNNPNDYAQRIIEIESKYLYYSAKAREYVVKNHNYNEYKTQWLNIISEVSNA